MHPEVAASAPGDCPICKMALEPIRDAPRAARSLAMRPPIVDGVRRRVLGAPVRAPAWRSQKAEITALLHEDDLVGMAPGAHAQFFSDAAPAVGIDVRLLAEPPIAVDGSTCRVRFAIDRSAPALTIDRAPTEIGLLQIAARSRELLTVPASAVLYSDEGPYVLAASGDDAFFWDAERRLRLARGQGHELAP
jgi:hypothetical protein